MCEKINPYWIKVIDPIESLMSPELGVLVKEELSYPTEWYGEGQYHKIRNEGSKSTILGRSKKGHLYYTGLTSRILKFTKNKKIEVNILSENMYSNISKNVKDVTLPESIKLPSDINLRKFQEEGIPKAQKRGRGVFIAPTGTGKTIFGLVLIKSLPVTKVLWLCHTKDLMWQTIKDAGKLFPNQIGVIGDKQDIRDKFITVATRQSFKKLADELGHLYDLVLVDEVHHIKKFYSSKKDDNGRYLLSEYPSILKKVYAEYRYGLTATMEKDKQAVLAVESFIGPIIGEYTVEEGIKDGVMSKPRLVIEKLPLSYTIKNLRTYEEVYEFGIVKNLTRNRMIIDAIKKYNDQGLSVLVFINHIIHGELLERMARSQGLDTRLVNGETESSLRMEIKEQLTKKEISSAISSTVWTEGVNIPTLNVVLNAADGKSMVRTLQLVGRGLRTSEGKTELIIHDFFDPSHKFLISHFGERISLYCDKGWL